MNPSARFAAAPTPARAALAYGAAALTVAAGIALVFTGEGAEHATIMRLRLARAFAAVLAGASLAVGGALVQGLFRNPLASPSILGTTAGASLGGQVALLLAELVGLSLRPELVVPIGCLAGALASLLVLLLLLRRTEDLLTLLLTGFLLNSLFLAVGSLIMSFAQEQWQLGRAVVNFALGTLSGVGTPQLRFAAPLVLVALAMAVSWSRVLDLLLTGEREAKSLGAPVESARFWVVVWTSVLVAAAVSLAGSLAFVGLVVPHVLRPFVGVRHRRLIPACAIAGAAFVLLCDGLARALPSQGEVPLGVVSALVGAPTFLVLLLRERAQP
ncbi:MAG: iron ABC transporter permease [Myxococcota bacterium]